MGYQRWMRDFIRCISRTENPEDALKYFNDFIEKNFEARKECSRRFSWLVTIPDSTSVLTEQGILGNQGFFLELRRRIGSNILSPVYPKSSLQHLLQILFEPQDEDGLLKAILSSEFPRLLSLLSINQEEKSIIQNRIGHSLRILVHRIVSIGTESELLRKIPDAFQSERSFFELSNHVNFLVNHLQDNAPISNEQIDQCLEKLEECKSLLKVVHRHKDNVGISLRMAYLAKRLEQHTDRLNALLTLLKEDEQTQITCSLIREISTAEFEKRKVKPLFSQTLNLLAVKVVEQTSRRGENFIAVTRKAWYGMLQSAMGGGLIVSLMVVLKILIHKLHAPPFIEAILYSLNYGLGFTFVHLSGFTIATKQPAMTASTLAGALKSSDDPELLKQQFIRLVKRISSTQFIALIGNILIVGPLTWLWSEAWKWGFGTPLLSHEEALKALENNHPWYSLTLLYAVLTGFYLMISGLTAGYTDNQSAYDQFPDRIREHGMGKKLIGPKRMNKLAEFLKNNLGALAGNFSLGFLLGSTATIGAFIGIAADIRHVTFLTGNICIGFSSLGNQINMGYASALLAGIWMVGTINVLTSFGLSLWVAMRSRGIKTGDTPGLLKAVLMELARKPYQFFFPTSSKK